MASARPPAAGVLVSQVRAAYQEAVGYRAVSEVALYAGERTMVEPPLQRFRLTVAVDREGNRLLVSCQDFASDSAGGTPQASVTVLRSGQELLVAKADPVAVEGQRRSHLAVPVPRRWSFSWLASILPRHVELALADLLFLLTDHPLDVLAGVPTPLLRTLAPLPDDPEGRWRLVVEGGSRRLTLLVDPSDWLLKQLVAEPTGSVPLGILPDGRLVQQIVVTTRCERLNEAPDQTAFAVDLVGSLEATGTASLFGPMAPYLWEGRQAPQVKVVAAAGSEPVSLPQASEGWEVLCLWAARSQPSLTTLQRLQGFWYQARAEGWPVRVTAVASRESPEAASDYWRRQHFELPLVVDPAGEVAGTFGLLAVPSAIVLRDGRVEAVEIGFQRDFVERLAEQVRQSLAD